MMILGHSIELRPNNKHRQYFAKSCGVARFAYNWALKRWSEKWDEIKHLPKKQRPKLREADFRKDFNDVKKTEYPWVMEVSKCAPQEAIRHLGKAFSNYIAGRTGHPRYRKKYVDDRFTLINDQFKVRGKYVHLPKLGWVRMAESLRFEGKIMNATISRKADRWFIAFGIEIEDTSRYFTTAENQGEVVGLDAGLRHLAVLSNGDKVEAPKSLSLNLDRLARVQQSLSKKMKGSRNRAKAKLKVAKLHRRISNIRKDWMHKLTTRLSKMYGTISIETLDIMEWLKDPIKALSTADAALFEMKRQLRYKMPLRGGTLIEAHQYFPSSQLCNRCGWRYKELKLEERQWVCQQCGETHDRDVNAALNLKNYAVSCTVNAPQLLNRDGLTETSRPNRNAGKAKKASGLNRFE